MKTLYKKCIPTMFFVLLIALMVGSNYLYDIMTVNQLYWLLYPSGCLFSLLSGFKIHWVPNEGYEVMNHQILIEKSCAGFKYFSIMLIVSLLLLYLGKIKLKAHVYKTATVPVLIYLYVVMINAFRLITSVGIKNSTDSLAWFPNNLAHELIGVLYYLLGLFTVYFFLKSYFSLKF